MTNTAISTESAFVKPYYIEELGEEGLTAHDIAKGLGVRFKNVHEKCKRWVKRDTIFRMAVYTAQQEIQEVTGHRYKRNIQSYLMPTRTAKAFIARWENNLGDDYLDFLFNCEYIVTQKLPKILAQNETLKLENEKLRQAKFKKEHKNHKTIVGSQMNLFGEVEPIYESKPLSEMSKSQKQIYRQMQRLNTIEGLIKSAKEGCKTQFAISQSNENVLEMAKQVLLEGNHDD